jgi:hypothetical protein
MDTDAPYVAFAGTRQVAAGTLAAVLPILKQRFDADRSEIVLVFEDASGRQVDFDLRGSLDEVLARALPPPQKGPGRPRLGVASREISLLPRHWEWLDEQPSGASAALRRLVEHAIKNQPGQEQARRIRAALSRFLLAMAGDRPNYEEACRALFAGDDVRLEGLIGKWPKDIREHVLRHARAATQAETAGRA